jgi:hypothetical protein
VVERIEMREACEVCSYAGQTGGLSEACAVVNQPWTGAAAELDSVRTHQLWQTVIMGRRR